MRKFIVAAGLLLISGPAFAADPVFGEWYTLNKSSKVNFGPCATAPSLMCGVITWLPANEVNDLDKRNPNASLQSRRIMGMATVTGFKQTGAGQWSGGKLYDPATGKSYNGKIAINPNGTLKVEGCVSILCQAQTWTRP